MQKKKNSFQKKSDHQLPSNCHLIGTGFFFILCISIPSSIFFFPIFQKLFVTMSSNTNSNNNNKSDPYKISRKLSSGFENFLQKFSNANGRGDTVNSQIQRQDANDVSIMFI